MVGGSGAARVSDRFSDALADVDEGVWAGLSHNQVGPRPSINVCRNRVRTFATCGARAAQTRCPITSNLGQKYLISDRSTGQLEVGFIYRGWTAAFYPGGVLTIRHVE